MACLAGTAGMFLSIRFMNMESTDTMRQLEAVLITTFWLATHVPIINLGYAAGMVAAIFSMFYFGLRFLVLVGMLGRTAPGSDGDSRSQVGLPAAPRKIEGRSRIRAAQDRDLTRIAYAFVCAGLFLSLVGTVLGGIWANYSWGRFWGWDPKENGALMIVLMNLVILHARLGGYIREVGLSCVQHRAGHDHGVLVVRHQPAWDRPALLRPARRSLVVDLPVLGHAVGAAGVRALSHLVGPASKRTISPRRRGFRRRADAISLGNATGGL